MRVERWFFLFALAIALIFVTWSISNLHDAGLHPQFSSSVGLSGGKKGKDLVPYKHPWAYDCSYTYTFELQFGGGMGSQLSHLLLCSLYALVTNRTFLIDSLEWNYGDYHEIFEHPLLKTCDSISEDDPPPSYDYDVDYEKAHVRTWPISHGMIGWIEHDAQHRLPFDFVRKTAQSLFQPSKQIREEFLHNLRPEGVKEYYGMHLRRGDKFSESVTIDTINYVLKIEELASIIEGRDMRDTSMDVFVASDDVRKVNKFR